MNRDEIFSILKNECLILELGSQALKGEQSRRHLASQKMRAAARVVQQLRQIDSDGGVTMNDFLKPSKFDIVIQAVEDVSGQVEGDSIDNELQRPSFALTAGYDLAWLARIKRAQAIRSHDNTSEEEASKFLLLHQSEWGFKVSAGVCNSLNTRKSKKPKTSYLQKLLKYVLSEVNKCNKLHSTDSTSDYNFFKRMQKVTLVRLLLFKKRRPMELSRITVDTVSNRPGWANSKVDELVREMSSLERRLLESHDL